MSGSLNKDFELKQSNCNESAKQNVAQCDKYSNTINCNTNSKDSSNKTDKFNSSSSKSETKFPLPPRLNKAIAQNYFNSDSDTSDSDKCYLGDRGYSKTKKPPPIGVFWDIENCQVPKGRSAVSVARLIRDLFFNGYREAEFVVVCDVKKESSQIIQELNDAQVTLIHVASTCKNAADEKLRQALRRFADTYGAPAAVILISGDINFAADLSDLRHRKKLHVILIHKENAADALILCASEHYNYTNITQALPLKETKPTNGSMEVIVRNLPKGHDPIRLRNRLKQLSDNCGGRVVYVSLENGTAVVRFNNLDVAVRAQRRMDGEDVYGNKISVSYPNTIRNWEKSYSPYKIPVRKVSKNNDTFAHPSIYGIPPPPLPLSYSSSSGGNPRKNMMDQNIWGPPNSLEYAFNSADDFQIKKKQHQKSSGLSEASCNMRSLHGAHGGAVLSDYTNSESWRPHSASFTEGKRSRTPNDSRIWSSGSYTALNTLGNDDSENQIQSSSLLLRSNSMNNSTNSYSPVDLLVTNLDQNLDIKDIKMMLLTMFQEYAMVLNISVFHQCDGNIGANVRVSSQQDAQYVISQLHRRKIGHKKIVISYAQTSTTNPLVLRNLVISLLQEVPGNRMPLFKFRELLETRYRTSVPVSELYKLKDICNVNEELGGRMISLNLNFRTTPSPHLSHSGLESAHCLLHCPNGLGERGWAEPDTPSLPNVRFKLKIFSGKVHELLHSHMGSLPLSSFPVCYELENGEKLPVDESGVPLEHLITCVVGVDLRYSSNMVKYLIWGSQLTGNDSTLDDGGISNSLAGISAALKCVSPPLATQLALFSRELVDLLKTAPHCQLPLSRFIPAYHHHFGRQCRVADYGYTKLVDLFESLSHVVQIVGEGNKRALTLSHAAQVRRFTSDLLRVLKSQVSKQVTLSDFSAAYERVLSRCFDPVDYGLCELIDLLDEVPENTIVVKQIENHLFIAIPKKEQTPEEILKTKQFSIEVVDLLKHAPQYGMLFNKFVPAYHHHFGHQCRVSDYGFSKLIELFEAIPDIVKIEEMSDSERKVSLTPKEAFKVLQQQLTSLVKNSKLQSVPFVALSATFLRQYGYPLRPELYECYTIEEIINKLSHSLQLVPGPAGPMLVIAEQSNHQELSIKIWSLLLNRPHTSILSDLLKNFHKKFNYSCNLKQIENYRNMFEVKHINNDAEISLTPRYVFAARLYHLLFESGGTLPFNNIDGMYLRKYGSILRPSEYDAATINILLSQLSFLVTLKGRRNKRLVSLNTNVAAHGISLPLGMKRQQDEQENANSNEVHWPPPPAHTYLFNSGRTTSSPPKPDTPPSRSLSSHWENSTWNNSSNFSPSLNLCIPLPFGETPPIVDNPYSLTSPMKNLLPAFLNEIQPPDPCELPMPSVEFLNKSKTASPSKDSGISSTSFTNSAEEPDSSTNFDSENTTPKKKRHLRLAAHFTTPLNLT